MSATKIDQNIMGYLPDFTCLQKYFSLFPSVINGSINENEWTFFSTSWFYVTKMMSHHQKQLPIPIFYNYLCREGGLFAFSVFWTGKQCLDCNLRTIWKRKWESSLLRRNNIFFTTRTYFYQCSFNTNIRCSITSKYRFLLRYIFPCSQAYRKEHKI